MLRKIDKYVLSEFWLPLISGAGIITGVWLGIDKFKEVFRLLAKSGASFGTGFVILGLETPQILAITIPISILLATFLGFQKLSSQSEVIAMRAAGLSFTSLMKPVIILGLLGVVGSFFLSEFVVPISTPLAKKVYTLALYKDPIAKHGVHGFSYFEKNSKGAVKRIFYVRRFKNEKLRDVVILDFSKKNLSMIHTAKEGNWDPAKGGWVLKDGSSSYIKASTEGEDPEKLLDDALSSGSMHLVTNFETTLIPSSLRPHEIMQTMSNLRDMNFWGLRKFIKLHEDDLIYTNELNEVKTKYYNKYAYPFSCIFLAIIGACLGIVGRRRAINWGYIVLGLVVFVFYMSQTVFDSFGQSGRIEPMLSVWMPNIILAVLASLVFFYRSNR